MSELDRAPESVRDSFPGAVTAGRSRDAPTEAPIAVAMSGGLDSSVTAALLAAEGRPVVGLSMLLWDRSQETRNGRCCGALDLSDARRVADQVGIPHYTLRMDQEFRQQVVDPFVDDYLAGRTPSPCIRCNTWIKFDLLLERASSLGIEKVATGHYARILEVDGEYELHRARDLDKDQSYYLFELNQRQLAAASFPLGELTKTEVRTKARELGLVVAEKGESYEVCFVGSSIHDFVEKESEERGLRRATEGAELVDQDGKGMGTGAPYYGYTVGQRRGLGIAASQRLYVLGVEAEHNRVVVGSRSELEAPGLVGERVHWIGEAPDLEDGGARMTVRIRSRHGGVESRVERLGPQQDRKVAVHFERPQTGVAPGQAAVFYRDSRVLGGCWITESMSSFANHNAEPAR